MDEWSRGLVLLVLTLFLLNCHGQSSIRQQGMVENMKNRNKAGRLPGLDVCGSSIFTFGNRVIDGDPAELGEFPWMAVIGYVLRGSTNINWLCGGSLITDRFVATASHCLHPSVLQARRPYVATTVRLGELDLSESRQDGASPMDYVIDRIILHEQYDNIKKINDIALIRLQQKVEFTKYIKPICLPPFELASQSFVGYNPSVAGWGKSTVNEPSKTDTRLLKAEIQIKDTESCRRNITSVRSLANAVIDRRVVCASAPGKDSCQGDSGGPLMLFTKLNKSPKNSKGNYFLMGIVSYGYGCAIEGYPGVYTRVSEYMAWIVPKLD